MTTGERSSSRTRTSTTEITLLQIDSPVIVRDDRTIALPIHSWLSAGFWDLFGLPRADRALAALSFGTESAPRTYLARRSAHPTTWKEEPLAVDVPTTIGPGPGRLEISGPMTRRRRRLVERTTLVIALAAPVGYRPHQALPDHMWEEDRWHTTVLVPGARPVSHPAPFRKYR
ncbi:hypothetical protein [Nocardia jinanensis]|uniref:Uncharacterized protein n=1 Tax=Nocardia jinanensis TaxID=382504 RepID=A0A917VXJ1_9NOCA|nr:hypothetical protein [Nocardia jinanensis]GGL40741.1 hypothetical protein GCM10011588_64390 [Nocardia jinanensis]